MFFLFSCDAVCINLVHCSWNTYKLSNNQYSCAYARWLWRSKYSLILMSLSFQLSHISHISNWIRQIFATLCKSRVAYSAFIHKPVPRKHWYFLQFKLKIHVHECLQTYCAKLLLGINLLSAEWICIFLEPEAFESHFLVSWMQFWFYRSNMFSYANVTQ